MKRALPTLTTITISIACCVAGCDFKQSNSPEVTAPVAPASALDRVTVGNPVKKTLQLFSDQPGRVTAFEEAPIYSKLSGYVESVEFDIGDKVSKGQVLLRVRAPEYSDQLEQKRGLLGQAKAEVKQAEAALVAAQAAANSAKSLVSLAEAAIGRTDAEYSRWASESARMHQLVSRGSVTQKVADEAASQLKSADAARDEANARIESTKAQLQEAEAKVLSAQADIDAAKAKLKVAQSDIAQAETMLAYTALTAPFDGIVTSRNVDAGHYVQPASANNAKPLIAVANVSKVRVFVNVPESEAAWVDAGFEDQQSGDSVTIFSPSLPNGKMQSRVTRTSQQLDLQSRCLSVEMDLDNSNRKLLPGAFVTTKLLLEKRENVLSLPTGAIVNAPDGAKCCVVVDGKIQHRPIQLGMRVGDEVEIKSGLDGKETVVLLRASMLQVGQSVEVIGKPAGT